MGDNIRRLCCAIGITRNDRKRYMLLHYTGEEVYNIFDTLQDTGTSNDYTIAKQTLEDHFNPQKNVEFEIYKFRQARQNSEETMDGYCSRLRQLAEYCKFQDNDREIKSQIIQGCKSARLRRRSLREQDMILKTLLDIARAMEIAQLQAAGIENNSKSLNFTKRKQTNDKGRSKFLSPKHNGMTKYFHCGGNWLHKEQPCRAKGKDCRHCHKVGHFSKVCKSTTKKPIPTRKSPKINNIEDNSDDEYVFSLNGEMSRDLPKVSVRIECVGVRIMIDSRASINILSERVLKLIRDQRKVKRCKTTTNIYTYGSKSSI